MMKRSEYIGYTMSALLGVALGMYLNSDSGKSMRKELVSCGKKTYKKFEHIKEDVKEILTDIFGRFGDDLLESYQEIKDQTAKTIGDLSEVIELNKENYKEIVSKQVHKMGRHKNWSSLQMQLLIRHLVRELSYGKENQSKKE